MASAWPDAGPLPAVDKPGPARLLPFRAGIRRAAAGLFQAIARGPRSYDEGHLCRALEPACLMLS
ncbi:hypothetical protein AQPW35_50270 [Rubrivivax pictus]|uniref:Uncharacterized protein n=1 Tax=Pseudaquabacterium pictum TaxID=2315236 RepID=A0A480AYE4_9BURK|nr:hypothetical protein AQPW35_50270 [Rubrivivax pictus]